jgi:hypothetical protein
MQTASPRPVDSARVGIHKLRRFTCTCLKAPFFRLLREAISWTWTTTADSTAGNIGSLEE